jgi:uncharacterized protein YcbX
MTHPTAQSSVASLWRYPVKSMQGEELNAADVTAGGLFGDRRFAVVDPATGKVAGAKNPRRWPGFFDFRAAYTEPPRAGQPLPAVRVTMPDGSSGTTDEADLPKDSGILRAAARHNGAQVGVYAEVIAGGHVRRGDRVTVC